MSLVHQGKVNKWPFEKNIVSLVKTDSHSRGARVHASTHSLSISPALALPCSQQISRLMEAEEVHRPRGACEATVIPLDSSQIVH